MCTINYQKAKLSGELRIGKGLAIFDGGGAEALSVGERMIGGGAVFCSGFDTINITEKTTCHYIIIIIREIQEVFNREMLVCFLV